MGAIIRTGFKNIMFDQLSGEVEQKISRLKKSNNTFTKRCMVVPSVMRRSSASIVHSRRRNGSSKTNLDLPGQRFELAYSHFNLMFLRFWFEWSFGRECDAYDKLGSGRTRDLCLWMELEKLLMLVCTNCFPATVPPCSLALGPCGFA